MKKILCSIMVILFVLLTQAYAFANDEKIILQEIAKKLSKQFSDLDDSLESAAKKAGKTSMKNVELRKILTDLYKSNPNSVDCTFVGADGVMKMVEPAKFRSFEGTDISKQEQILRLHKTKKPVMSKLFLSVEKIYSIDIEYPVFSRNGNLTGSLSILYKPEKLAGNILNPYIKKTPYKFSILQTDGICVLDSNEKLIGKNLKDLDLKKSPGMANAVKAILKDRDGRGEFNITIQNVGKDMDEKLFWTTVELYGTEWRIVLIRYQ